MRIEDSQLCVWNKGSKTMIGLTGYASQNSLSFYFHEKIYVPKYLPYFHSDYKAVNKAWHVVFLISKDIKTVH